MKIKFIREKTVKIYRCETKRKKANLYIDSTYLMLFLLMMCCDIVDTSIYNCKRLIIMIDKIQ